MITSGGTQQPVVTTLGALVTSAADYEKTVNYSANGVTGWKVFYKQTVGGEEYVYLIASEKIPGNSIPKTIPGTTVSGNNIYWTTLPTSASSGTINKDLWLANWNNGVYTTGVNAIEASYFLDETYWTSFKNTTLYGENVVGAIGTPTLEMFVESWNAKGRAKNDTTSYIPLQLTENGTTGYKINEGNTVTISTQDQLYVWSTDSSSGYIWLATPSASNSSYLMPLSYTGMIGPFVYNSSTFGIRPVVCLKSSTPAYAGGTADKTHIVLQ